MERECDMGWNSDEGKEARVSVFSSIDIFQGEISDRQIAGKRKKGEEILKGVLQKLE